MKLTKRLFAALLAFAVLTVCVPFVNAARLESVTVIKQSDVRSASAKSQAFDPDEYSELVAVLTEGFENHSERIDVSSFKIPSTEEGQNALAFLIYDEMPLAFYVNYIGVWRLSGYIVAVAPVYFYEKDECAVKVEEYKAEADKIIADLRENSAITDVEKALLVHDRLALHCEFDLGDGVNPLPDEVFNGYGALVDRKAVCHGYSEAYTYMLTQLGIKCIINRSEALNHTWNIITIDGKDYHVDVTWDDPIWSATKWNGAGIVNHNNFMLSSSALYESHSATDYDTSPTDTSYDSYYWQGSTTAFQLINGKLYYINKETAELCCKTDETVACSVSARWYASSNSYWSKNYSCLASDGEVLYYSTPEAIMEYNPKTGVSTEVHKPDLSVGDYFYIYGFTYEDGYFIYDINNSPNLDNEEIQRVRFKYEKAQKEFFTFASGADTSCVVYDEANGLLTLSKADTSVEGLKALFADTDLFVSEANGTEKISGMAGTGCKVSSVINGATKTLTVIVMGDTSGDGVISTNDYIALVGMIKNSRDYSSVYYVAGDINADSVTNSADYVALKIYLVK